MRVQVPTNHQSTPLWRKQQEGNWSCQSTCGEMKYHPPSSLTRDCDDGSWSRDPSDTSRCPEFTVSNRAVSSSSLKRNVRWKQPLSTSSQDLDIITSSIYDEHDILDEILGYNKEVATDGNCSRVASCGAFDVVALPATECIDGRYDHTSELIACIDPTILVTNVSHDEHDAPYSNFWSFFDEVIPHPGRSTGRFEQFMDVVAFPENHFSFDATKCIQSLHKVPDCMAFPERYLDPDNKATQPSLVPKIIASSKNGCVEYDRNLGKDGHTEKQKMITKGRDFLVNDACRDANEVVGTDSSIPILCDKDQISNNLSSGVAPSSLEQPCDARNDSIRNSSDTNGSDGICCILDDLPRREDEDKYRETHFVTRTKSVLSDTSSVSTVSEIKKSDSCSAEMGMELVLVSKTNDHRTKKKKNLVQRCFGIFH